MPFKIVRNDITKMETEAIVNTAAAKPTVGSGCDSAIYKAAGFKKLLAYRKEKIGYVPEGDVFITPGFGLPAKYIIHAVSPLYLGGGKGEEEKLRSCYRKGLQLAKEHGIKSIAFPLISTGSFGYPKEEGLRIAGDEINAFLLSHEMMIYLVVFSDKATSLGSRIYPDLEEYIDRHYVEGRLEEEYEYDSFPPSVGSGDLFTGNIPDARRAEMRRQRAIEERRAFEKASEAPAMESAPVPVVPPKKKTAKSVWGDSIFKKESQGSTPSVGSIKNKPPKQTTPSAHEQSGISDAEFKGGLEGRLEERMRHMSDTFSQYLLYLIQEKKMENAEVYKRAVVDKKIFSKIKNNVDYHPQKLTALCLCVGAKLNMDESRDLLARAGYALSPCDKMDIIFAYFIEHGIYDMIELDIQLEEHGLPCIIT